ncbi:MAG: hypothetical protein WC649_00200 [Desulfobacteria bacterium]
MKAIVITTINVIENLHIIHERCPGWIPIIVGDLKTPHDANRQICKEVDGIYLDPETQMKLGFTHAAAIPWNCYGRKNIGYLFALKEGARLLFLTDDDNVPVKDWTDHIRFGVQQATVVSSNNGWYNCYCGADAGDAGNINPRGYPTWLITEKNEYRKRQEEADIGVIAGLHLGSPDVDAVTRLVKDPYVSAYQEKEVTTDIGTMCPYDSQNTIIMRELMPANMLWSYPNSGWTRYDDIFAGYVGQVIAWKYGYRVRFGRPFVVQERNPHDILKDLIQEMNGMKVQRKFFEVLRNVNLNGKSPAEDLHILIYELLNKIPELPRWLKNHVDTWTSDLRTIGLY